jgi:hypothetical protein
MKKLKFTVVYSLIGKPDVNKFSGGVEFEADVDTEPADVLHSKLLAATVAMHNDDAIRVSQSGGEVVSYDIVYHCVVRLNP